jgi:beta-glucanase (GH16 family)
MITTASPAPADDWKLVWSDEFDHTGLPDPTKWDYEEGFIRNGESQYYTRQRPENARVEGGMLILECRNDHYTPENPQISPWAQVQDRLRDGSATAPFTSASLLTKNKVSWQYGRVEVRAKVPQGRGVWPAVWMLGDSFGQDAHWPACGEIDLMEFVGNDPHHIHGTLHCAQEGRHRKNPGKMRVPQPFDGFHVYALEWTEHQIDFLFDGTVYHSVLLDEAGEGANNPFRKPFFLLINLAFGGSWGGQIAPSILPQQFVVDYVRVYERPSAPPISVE